MGGEIRYTKKDEMSMGLFTTKGNRHTVHETRQQLTCFTTAQIIHIPSSRGRSEFSPFQLDAFRFQVYGNNLPTSQLARGEPNQPTNQSITTTATTTNRRAQTHVGEVVAPLPLGYNGWKLMKKDRTEPNRPLVEPFGCIICGRTGPFLSSL